VQLQSKFNYEVAKKVAYSPSRSFGSLRGRFVRQSRDHVAVVLAWAAYRLELGDHDNVNQIAALFCPGEPQPLRAAAHVFAVAEIPPPMIAQVEGGIFTSTSIPFGAMQRDRNQA
jgi:hypothetical protein